MLLREWICIALVLGFLAAVGVIAKFSEVRSRSLIVKEEATPLIKITLSGAVERPGVYQCRPGTPLTKLLDQAGISKLADRGKTPFKKILLVSQSVEIPGKRHSSLGAEKISLKEN